MSPIYYVLILAVIGAVLALAVQLRNRRRDNDVAAQQRDAEKRLAFEAQLQPGESLLAMCSNDKVHYCALTEQRLILEDKKGTHTIALNDIKKLTGKDAQANKTTDPASMLLLQVKADKTYHICNYSSQFVPLAKELMARCQG